MRIGKIIKWLFILLLVVIVGGIAFLFTLDLNNYKPTIQNQARNALGRDLAIDGDIGLALSLIPSISIDGVRLANAEGLEPADMISVGHVEAQIELLPLISGDIRIGKLVLQDADIHLQADDQGGGNWVFGEAAAEEAAATGPAKVPFLGDVLLENVKLTYTDPAGEVYRVALTEATVQSASLDSPVELAITGTVQDEELKVAGTVGSVQHLLDQRADWPFELTAEVAGASAGLKGAISDTETFGALSADLTASIDDATRLGAMAGVTDLPAVPPVSVASNVSLDGTIAALSGLTGTIGDTGFDGNLTARLGEAVPAVQGVLNFGDLDLDVLLPAGESAPAPAGDGRIIPDMPLPLDGLTAANADIAITAQSVKTGEITVSDIAADISLTNGVLEAVLKQATVFDGLVNATVQANAGDQSVDLDLDYDRFSLGPLLSSQGLGDRLTGTGTVAAAFSGAAPDLRSLLAAGIGSLDVDIIGGTLDTSQLSPVSRTLLKLLLPTVESGGVIALNCAVVGYDLEGGIARSNGILLDTPVFAAVAEGALDVRSETMDMLARAQSGDVAGLSLSAPVRIAGPWTAPVPTLDAQAVVGGLTQGLLPGVEPSSLRVPNVDPPSGDVNQCAAALANPTYPELPGVGQVGDTIKNVIDQPSEALEGAGKQLLEGITGGGEDGADNPAEALGDALKNVLPGGSEGGGLRNLLGN